MFNFLVNIVSASGFITWFGISLSHDCFRKKVLKGDTSKLIYKAIWFPFGPIFAMVLVAIITLGQFYTFNGVYSLANISSAYGAFLVFIAAFLYDKSWRSKRSQNQTNQSL